LIGASKLIIIPIFEISFDLGGMSGVLNPFFSFKLEIQKLP
jgi:hypothetical protein